MTIDWSDEDQAYMATVPELPGCQTHGLTYEDAVKQGQDAIASWIDARIANGRDVPAPRVFAQATTPSSSRQFIANYESGHCGSPAQLNNIQLVIEWPEVYSPGLVRHSTAIPARRYGSEARARWRTLRPATS